MSRSLESFPLPPTAMKKLKDAGFEWADDVFEESLGQLATELSIDHAEALKIVETLRGSTVADGSVDSSPNQSQGTVSRGQSAVELLLRERNDRRILTLCQQFDKMLGGGIAIGQVVEICGVPGIGKTQLGIQLCCDVQMPLCLNGLAGSALYIDTEGSFLAQRAEQIARSLVEVVNGQVQRHCEQNGLADQSMSVEQVLSNIFVIHINDYVEQLACVRSLPDFVDQHPNIRLVIVDSVSFQFRQFEGKFSERTRLLSTMSQQLSALAHQKQIAVVLMNQVTTKISQGDKSSSIVPALGETWAHACTTRVMLEWDNTTRVARLLKSPCLRDGRAPFKIGKSGVRGVAGVRKRQRPQ
eukprot:159524_1